MQLHHEEPPVADALKPYISRCLHTYSEADSGFCMALPPTGVMYLTFVYGDEMTLQFGDGSPAPSPRLFVGGQVRRYTPVSRIPGRVGLMGVEFAPTGFHQLFHQDCSTLTDRATPFHELMPMQAADLEDRLTEESDNASGLALLQDFLLERVAGALSTPVVDEAINQIDQAGGCINVDTLADRCSVGTRQLHRLFLKTVGIGPKHFAKSMQIKRVLLAIEQVNTGELTVLAQQAGYFDQAHFVHDFQRLIGTNPTDFLDSRHPFLTNYMNHGD